MQKCDCLKRLQERYMHFFGILDCFLVAFLEVFAYLDDFNKLFTFVFDFLELVLMASTGQKDYTPR